MQRVDLTQPVINFHSIREYYELLRPANAEVGVSNLNVSK
jgi:hypothetical protein